MMLLGSHRQTFLIVLSVLTFVLIVLRIPAIAGTSVIAQLSPPQLSLTHSSQLPPEVTQIGGMEVIPLKLHGETLFYIASPVVFDRNNWGNQVPVEVRARRIEEDLQYILSLKFLYKFNNFYTTAYDPKTLAIQVRTLEKQTVLTATDASRTEPEIIMTVTEQDAEYNGLSKLELAQKWRAQLQTVLVKELEARSPQGLQAWVQFSLGLILFLASISSILWFLLRWLNRYRQRLKERETQVVPTSDPELIAQRFELLRAFRRRDRNALKRSLIDSCRWLLIWLLILVWVIGFGFIVDVSPFIPLTMVEILIHPLEILLIWFVAGVINRFGNWSIYRSAAFWEAQQNTSIDRQRRSLRVATIANVIKELKTFLIYLIAVIWILNSLDFSTGSILAFGAIVGFAISLASQSLIRDLVNGFLILLEDQYAIGDVITVDTASGLVENLNLRTTQLRSGGGRLIILPNSTINRVENLTRTWSRVDHTIEVAANTDADRAIALIGNIAQSLYDDPEFQPLILEPPKVLGIDSISHAGIAISTWIKTQPLQQWKVGREFRLRLKNALDKHHIQLGMPQQQNWNASPDDQHQEDSDSPTV